MLAIQSSTCCRCPSYWIETNSWHELHQICFTQQVCSTWRSHPLHRTFHRTLCLWVGIRCWTLSSWMVSEGGHHVHALFPDLCAQHPEEVVPHFHMFSQDEAPFGSKIQRDWIEALNNWSWHDASIGLWIACSICHEKMNEKGCVGSLGCFACAWCWCGCLSRICFIMRDRLHHLHRCDMLERFLRTRRASDSNFQHVGCTTTLL